MTALDAVTCGPGLIAMYVPPGRSGEAPRATRSTLFRRLALSAATAFLAVNIWTGAPLFALWVGAEVVGEKQLTFGAVFIIVLVLGTLVLLMAFALARLNVMYDRLIGRPTRERRLTWLRSMREEDWRVELHRQVGITVLEWIVMASVCLAVLAFVVWFFVFAGSPLGHSG